jgi:EAL domain-containing protein (putative c-di-GMP-specific phosphodiesterase class I)/CheY-like chemotaxis protein
MHLLALDDEAAIGQLLGRIAAGIGVTVQPTTTAASFRAEFQAAVPDAIVLDLHIGDDDGIEQLRFLSAARYQKPVLLLSGLDKRLLDTARRVGESLGINIVGALTKPLRAAELREALNRLLPVEAWTPSAEALLHAIQAGELVLHFQPIVAAGSRRPIKAEALVRWPHPERGLVPPDCFIPVAENAPNLIEALTLWAIGEAGRRQHTLAARGLDLPVAVNISGRNLHDVRFPDRVQAIVQEAGATPSQLILELTETAAFQDPMRTADILVRLRIKGFELAIDDFGTGYSSLKVLKQLPVSILKIDRSFTVDMLTSPDSAAIARAIIDLARDMGLQSVAEGVETEAVAGMLQDLGVDALQGYFISRPLPIEAYAEWLTHALALRPHNA